MSPLLKPPRLLRYVLPGTSPITAASLPSSSSATVRNDRDRWLSNRSGEKKHLRLENQRRISRSQFNSVFEQDESWLDWAERPQ